MPIRSKLTEKDYINVNFVALYSKPSTKFFTILLALCLLTSILLAIFSRHGSIFLIILSFVMCLVVPVKTYYTSKKNFITNKRSGEIIEYEFDKDHLIIKGESFNTQSTWDKVYKVTRTKNWLLIWQNRQVAHPLPKRDIAGEQLADLKEILQKHKVKNNL